MKDNSISLVGNTTRDVEVAVSQAGNLYARFGMAVNRSRRNGDEWVEETSFFDVSVLDSQMAENVSTLPKGSRVTVTGWVQQRTVDQDDGTKRSYVSIVAEDVAASLRWATVSISKNPPKVKTASGAPSKLSDSFEPWEGEAF